jgi:predicted signal transduction protein with EAL and GGDEF domain
MARLGGDEFGVVLPELPDDETAVAIAGRLIKELERPLTVEGLSLDVSGSIGIALFPAHARDAESLIRRADVAMYAAKETRAGHEVYHRELDRHSPARLTLVSQVRPGIEHGEFVLHYQPKGRLADGSVTGVEALVRWRHPDRGLLPPAEFLPLVEHTVLLRPLTHHLLEAALRQWRTWYEAGIRIALSVNLSPRSLFDVELPNQVWRVLEETGVPPRSLILELTESFMVTDSGRSNAVLARLTDLGVEISIDDFGTGYSSLSHLKRISVDEIKIDRSFVGGMRDDPNDASIVKATVDLGRNLGLRVVAEGVEDRATWDLLAELACDEAQGYFLAHPMPAEAVTAWLSERTGVVVGDPTGDGAPVERGSQDRLRAV